MITPEFIKKDEGRFVLVANHSLDTDKHIELSISYNRARIANAQANLPRELNKCTLVYDLRGQSVTEVTVARLRTAFSHIDELKVMT
jgi:hypothetical protein